MNTPLAEVATPTSQGLSKEEFGKLFIDHKRVFLRIIYDFVIGAHDRLNENDLLDICQEILSRAFEGALKKRDQFDRSKGTFFTWMLPRIKSRCLDYIKKSYIGYEINDYITTTTEEDDSCDTNGEDTSDGKDSLFSDKQQFIDWVNTGGGDIADEPCIKLSKQENRSRRDDYLRDRLESLISIKNIREYKRRNPEYTLPNSLELLPEQLDHEIDIAIAVAKRVPREKIAQELGIPKNTLDQIIYRMGGKKK